MINNNEKFFKTKQKQLPNFDLIKSQQFNNFFQPYIFWRFNVMQNISKPNENYIMATSVVFVTKVNIYQYFYLIIYKHISIKKIG